MRYAMKHARHGFTFIELMIAMLVTTLVAATVVSLISGFLTAIAVQDLRSEAIVRSASIQAHLGLVSLKTRMSLSVSQQRVLLWLPAETLAESGSGANCAFDRIDLIEDELHWFEFVQDVDESWSLIEWTVKPELIPSGESEVYFTIDQEYWNNLFFHLRDSELLRRSPIAFGLGSPDLAENETPAPRFIWQDHNCCLNHSIGVEFAFEVLNDRHPMRAEVRLESALAFFDQHPICSEPDS